MTIKTPRPRRILVVEPDGIVASAYRLALAQGADHVHLAASTQDAIERIQQGGYDAIVVAPEFLPDVRGNRALRHLRVHTKAAFLTLFDHLPSLDERAAATAGGDDFLVKPVSVRGLLDKVRRLPMVSCATGDIGSTLSVPRTGGCGHAHAVMAALSPNRI